jgi:hypothetical protein
MRGWRSSSSRSRRSFSFPSSTTRGGSAAPRRHEGRIGEMWALLSESLRAIPVIKTYAMEPY